MTFLSVFSAKGDSRELKQTRRRRKRERHLKMWLRVSAIIFQLFKLIMLEKCVLTILELNWNQHLGHTRIKLNICHHMLTSSTQLQNRSFHVVERTRTSAKCQKMKNARAKHAKILFFMVKFVGFLFPSSSCLLKLPSEVNEWWLIESGLCLITCISEYFSDSLHPCPVQLHNMIQAPFYRHPRE